MSERTSGQLGKCHDGIHVQAFGDRTCECGARPYYWPILPQPSLTPADLIALRDEMWRAAKAVVMGERGVVPPRDVKHWADQLDVLITRLSSETEKEKP